MHIGGGAGGSIRAMPEPRANDVSILYRRQSISIIALAAPLQARELL
jgi:hypothetical protein